MDERVIMSAIAVLAVFVIASIVIGIICISKVNSILDYSEDGNLTDNLEKYYNSVNELSKKLKLTQEGAISERISDCESKINLALSKTGIVNFDAYEDVHGKQSFALAVLNRYNDGFVLTSIYGSASSNTYVREIHEGQCMTMLLDEEKEAVEKAVSGTIE